MINLEPFFACHPEGRQQLWTEKLPGDRLRSIEKQYGNESILLATGTNRGWVRYFNRFANAYGKQMP